jgi:queuine tRNA-ribosyltransferase
MGSINDNGARFKSPINGPWLALDPKKSIKIQLDLGTDMVVCLDDCPPNDADDVTMNKAIERTIRWTGECKKIFESEIKKRKIKKTKKPLLIAVIQGGESEEMRQYCALELKKFGFDGYGYGARPVDKDGNFLEEILQVTADASPRNAFRFALGIGTPEDIVRCSRMGYDVFDCVIPTREGRHGRLFYFVSDMFVGKGGQIAKFYKTINIANAKFTKDDSPINEDSRLRELKEYSKSYLHHLFKIKDPLGARLASLQNLEFYSQLMIKIKKSIKEGEL